MKTFSVLIETWRPCWADQACGSGRPLCSGRTLRTPWPCRPCRPRWTHFSLGAGRTHWTFWPNASCAGDGTGHQSHSKCLNKGHGCSFSTLPHFGRATPCAGTAGQPAMSPDLAARASFLVWERLGARSSAGQLPEPLSPNTQKDNGRS
jgi:hypothetical protein